MAVNRGCKVYTNFVWHLCWKGGKEKGRRGGGLVDTDFSV
jgi:hypothetical protein